SLANFSIAHDEAYILPVLRQAIALNPNVKVMATPWSPPAWMKNTDSLCGVANGTNSSLRSDAYQPLANYFVKFIQAYGAAGVKVDYVSLQNEPLYPPPGYTGMLMSSSEQKSLLNSYIAPAFRSANISAKVLLYDHNWDNSSYPNSLISDATTRANAAGVAWHHYGGDPATMTTVHDSSPELGHWVTEASGGDWQTGNILAEEGTELVKVMRNWSKAYVLWSMAQDQDRGPYATTPLGLHGCNNCRGVLKIAWDKAGTGAASVVTPELDYYVLGHASKFVKPGAVRIDSDQTVPSVSNVAFRNPDGSVVLYIANSTSTDSTFNVKYRGKFVTITVKSGSVATLVWTPETTPAISLVPENTGMRFASGRTGSLGMAVQPVSGTPTVSFGCAVVDASGATTTKASCSVWPSNMSFSDSSTQSAVLSVNSGSATVAKKPGSMRLVAMFTIGAAGACVVFSRHSRFAWLVAMFLLFTAVSCGGSGGASTPITPTPASVAGTYFATVTATTDAGAPVNVRIQVLVE
ncbi:MAG TPA: glycoside hydrolase family 30 beta sandwich domain-containing protein, partial [Terriglobales bacterium]